jgi:hypothetical protein
MEEKVILQLRHNDLPDGSFSKNGHSNENGGSSRSHITTKKTNKWESLNKEANSYEIGVKDSDSSTETFAEELSHGPHIIPREITDELIGKFEEMVEYYDREDKELLIEWLKQNKGKEVFVRVVELS